MTTPTPSDVPLSQAPRWLAVGLPVILVLSAALAVRFFLFPAPLAAVGECLREDSAGTAVLVRCSDSRASYVVTAVLETTAAETDRRSLCPATPVATALLVQRTVPFTDRRRVFCLAEAL